MRRDRSTPSGVSPLYRLPMAHNTCPAIAWSTGRRCGSPCVPHESFCENHLFTMPPPGWSESGYAALLDSAKRDLYDKAQFSDLSSEVALARLHLYDVIAQGGGTAQTISALNAVAKLVKLRRQLDQSSY